MNNNLKVLEKEYFRIKAVETSKDNFKLIYNASEIIGHVSFEVDKIDDEVMHMTFDFEREYVKFVHLREVLYLLADYYFNDLNLVRFVCFVDIQKQRIAEIFKDFGFMVLKNDEKGFLMKLGANYFNTEILNSSKPFTCF